MAPNLKYDVVIIGAGVVGMIMATLLSRNNLKVCLVDKNEGFSLNEETLYLGRTAALNLFSIRLLQDIGVWKDIAPYATTYSEIKTWDTEGSSGISFHASEVNLENLGAVVSNNALMYFLNKFNFKNENINFIKGSSLENISEMPGKLAIKISEGKKIFTEVLIGADGGLSTVRKKAKIRTKEWSYEQKAIVAVLSSEKDHCFIARQIFTPQGPIALLPYDSMNESRLSLVWSIDNKSFQEVSSLNNEDFCALLQLKVEGVLGDFKLHGKRNSFPLHQIHAKKYFKGRVALVGDAAHVIHPLAGQGLNLGIADAESLSRVIIQSKRKFIDIGSEGVLSKFQKERFLTNMRMMSLMEAFKRGFEVQSPWLKYGRNLLFKAIDKPNNLKRKFIKEATGI